MFELLIVVVFCWLFFKAVKLAFSLTWGIAKGIVSLLLGIAVPLLGACLMLASGAVLIIPVLLILAALGLLKAVL